ncbi:MULTISPECIES: sprT domain-containing protein [Spirosoma]|uniref:SprT domain-containing protein n=1 Tax=Spirosoma sordidisoli TaxID=2502893 RepID=A0A4Q2UP82_9BACT|nr:MULTISPECIES: sprT domain-containing protein [Spirosoma]RYC68629.1 sprT domain-containing protein [Spirosoma sordidisoli]
MSDLFAHHLPATAALPCRQLQQQYGFAFRVTKPRRTKLGDFRRWPDGRMQITVNANLNPYAFLITYVHEVAHAVVSQTHKRRVVPHGTAWQQAFQRLMQPFLHQAVFPADVLLPLQQYMSRPAATTYASPVLMAALRRYDQPAPSGSAPNTRLLRDVPEGSLFLFAKKTYQRGTMRRTRVVCKELSSGRSYAILAHAVVEMDT